MSEKQKYEFIDLQWFAAEDEGRTEEPSDIKIEKARKEGRVAKSQEVNGALVFLCATLSLWQLSKWLLDKFYEVLQFFFSRCAQANAITGTSAAAFFNYFLKMVLPVATVSLLAGVISNFIQNRGWMFSTKPIQPDFKRILPKVGEYLKKTIFSRQGAFNVLKSIAKVAILIFIAFKIISSNIGELLSIIYDYENYENARIRAELGKLAWIAFKLLLSAAAFFLAISIPDYFVQKKEFLDSLKMTKQEVKEEYKEMEGDPEVKGRIKQAQKQLLASNVPRAVAESDVVITNPTHFAVALKYDTEKTSAPMVNAKGEDFMAQRIKQIARENDVPIVENRPLARSLYAHVDLGEVIPDEYFKAISLVYSHLEKFRK